MSQRKSNLPLLIQTFILFIACSAEVSAQWACSQDSTTGLWQCRGSGLTQIEAMPAQDEIEPLIDTTPTFVDTSSIDSILSQIEYQTFDFVSPHACYQPYAGPALGSIGQDVFQTAPIYISADQSELVESGESLLAGHVEVEQDARKLESNLTYYNADTQQVRAERGFRYREPGLAVIGENAAFQLDSHVFDADDIRYRIQPIHGRGEAKTVSRPEEALLRLEDATFTTCAPGSNTWLLSSDEILLNQEEGWGKAYKTKLKAFGTPIAYVPYYRFPIDNRRKSGFLSPSFGHSDDSGYELTIPYYWNIAPNYDATITAVGFSKRGLQLLSELRYLTPKSEGQFDLEIMPHDFIEDSTRGLAKWNHVTHFTSNWHTTVDAAVVTDDEYFDDLDDHHDLEHLNHLRQEGMLTYQGENTLFLTRVQGFQTLDDSIRRSQRPYQRLPQMLVRLDYPDVWQGLDVGLEAEAVYFHRDDSRSSGIRASADSGYRFHLMPSISLPLEAPYGFFTPTLRYAVTHYQLTAEASGSDSHFDRTLPIFSLDSGLFFDRQVNWFNQDYKQTLEPRLFYLYAPSREQDLLPNFDSSLNTFTFTNLFRYNRFNGRDRIGDANQLTLALTSRLLEMPNRRQRLRTRFGQVFFFNDRDVRLVEPNEDEDFSAFFAELTAYFNKGWSTRANLEWDFANDYQVDRGSFVLQYKPDPKRVMNLAYLYRKDVVFNRNLSRSFIDQNQVQVSFAWPVSRHLRLLAASDYDFDEGRMLSTLAGLEYDACCWALRLVGHRELEPDDDDEDFEYDDAIYLQLVLKGLGGVGRGADSLLKREIPGYDPELDDISFRSRYE